MKIIKENIVVVLTTSISVFVGIILAGLLYWEVTTLISTTKKVDEVIGFINSNIQASRENVEVQ